MLGGCNFAAHTNATPVGVLRRVEIFNVPHVLYSLDGENWKSFNCKTREAEMSCFQFAYN